MSIIKNNLFNLALVGLILILSYVFQNNLNPYFYKILVDVGIAIILAVSLNLINGITGQFSLGHAGFMGIGAYVSAAISVFIMKPWLSQLTPSEAPAILPGVVSLTSTKFAIVEAASWSMGIGVGIAVIIGGLAAAVAGLVIGIPTLRLKGDYLAIATLGFGEIIRIIILNTETVGGPRGMGGIPTLSNFFWVYFWALICLVVTLRFVHSPKGKALFAIREDEFAASTIGIDTTQYKVIAFIMGSFFAGVAGGLFAHSATGYVNPSQFDSLRSIEIVVMVVLGGLGSTSGAVIAAVVLTILPECLRGFSEYRMVMYSLLLIVMMLTRPQGLMGMKEICFPWRIGKQKVNRL